MIAELGHYALVMALFLSLVQSVLPLLGAARGKQAWMLMGQQAATSTCWLVSIAFLALLHAFTLSDFSVRVVAEHSHTMKPVVYKLAALWGHHEGSMLLWLWMLSFWGALVGETGKKLPPAFKARTLAVLGMIFAGFCLFILFTSNPFLRLDPPAPEGLDLNPVLQDVLLAVHPPMLYMGYVGFAVAFAFAAAALIEGRVDGRFASFVRPWVLTAWSFLTLGIGLGSFWAYYELGWGGFWFWDPVENASLMPWLAGLALMHSLTVLERKEALRNWTIFLAILAFSLSMLGTFLVRSGVLTSVHAFASDPARGVFILMLLAAAAGGAFLLYGFRAARIRTGASFGLFSREMTLLLNNVFLFAFAATVFMGTLYPIFLSALDLGAVSIGGPYYAAVLLPMLLPFALLMGAGPRLPWKENATGAALRKMAPPLLGSVFLTGALFLFPQPKTFVLVVGFWAAAWIFLSTLHDLLLKTRFLRSWRTLPLSFHAMAAAHAGFALMLFGAVAATQMAEEKILWMKPGDRVAVGGRNILLLTVETGLGPNYNVDRGIFSVQTQQSPGDYIFMTPEKRWYPAAGKETSEAALAPGMSGILYIVLGDEDPEMLSRRVVRIYYHPLVQFVFFGGVLMALGGLMGAFDRRRRPA